MKIADDRIDLERGGDIEEVTFSIEASAKAFEILSAGMYSDPVTAIIRELAANAADAHTEAGTTHIPFQVHAPNSLSPHFSIRDFGTGLEPSLIKKLYTRYFKSTKTQSDELTGCLGLGSKSPFSYVDSFTVITYWNKKKYIFNSFKNERRLPSIALLGETDTDEPNGLEVSFPVKSHDFNQFIDKIKKTLRFFKHLPVVKGVPSFEFPKFDYLIKTNDYGITASSQPSVVIMGNIAYPFDIYDFTATSDVLTSKEKKLVEWGVHFFVPIGSVEIAASREKLHYSESTRSTVKKIVAEAVEVTIQESRKKLEAAKSVWEARLLAGKLRKGAIGELSGFVEDEDVLWNGKKVNETIHLDEFKIKPSVEVLSTERENYRRRRRHHYGSTPVQTGSADFHKFNAQNFGVADYNVIFVNDLNRGGYAAARRYMEEHDVSKALMFSSAPDEFIDEVDCRHLLVPVSTLPKPERKKREPGQRNAQSRTTLQRYNGYELENVDVDLDEGGVYVEIRHNKVKLNHHFKSEGFSYHPANQLSYRLNLMRLLGFNEEIYGIRTCDKAKLAKSDGEWIDFEQALEDIVRNNSSLVFDASLNLVRNKISSKIPLLRKIRTDNPVAKRSIEIWEACYAANKNEKVAPFVTLNEYTNLFEIKLDESLVDEANRFLEEYPLLRYIHTTDYDEALPNIQQYIDMVDIEREAQREMEEAA